VTPLPSGTVVAPSILAADASRLADQVREVVAAGARVIHVDVMDGHFVPPITFGAQTVAALREQVDGLDVVLDVHLMVERPERHVASFAAAGADVITVHVEATTHIHYMVEAIRAAGCLAGAAICPGTPPDALAEVAGQLDLALCMTVDPGWGGQPFIATSPDRIRRLATLVDATTRIEVDGGIGLHTAPTCAAAGATLLVAGSAVFGAADPGAAYQTLAAAVTPRVSHETEAA
jgi:ribulose-phosphate 3-epimerase